MTTHGRYRAALQRMQRDSSKHALRIRRAFEAGENRSAKRLSRDYLQSHCAKAAAMSRVQDIRRLMTPEEILDRSSSLSVWLGSTEKVDLLFEPKDGGGFRILHSYGVENRALQELTSIPLLAQCLFHPSQYPRRQDKASPILAILGALSSGFQYCYELDIESCFSSFNRSYLADHLPLPKEVTNRVVLSNPDSSNTKKLIHQVGLSGSLHLAEEAHRGIPQGATTSSPVADLLISKVLHTHPDSEATVTVTFADNIVVLGRTKAAAESRVQTLRCAFKHAPYGPLNPRIQTEANPGLPFEILGYRFTPQGSAYFPSPSNFNLERFGKRFHEYMRRLKAKQLGSQGLRLTERKARAFVNSWCSSFRDWPDVANHRKIHLQKLASVVSAYP